VTFKLCIIGPESTGNHWISDVFALHPDVQVYNQSYPCYKYHARRYIPAPEILTDTINEQSWLIILTRDINIIQLATQNAGHNAKQPQDAFNIWTTLDKLHEQICQWPNKNIEFFSYESFIMWQDNYLIHILRKIGLDPQKMPFDKIQYKNGNTKYISNYK